MEEKNAAYDTVQVAHWRKNTIDYLRTIESKTPSSSSSLAGDYNATRDEINIDLGEENEGMYANV